MASQARNPVEFQYVLSGSQSPSLQIISGSYLLTRSYSSGIVLPVTKVLVVQLSARSESYRGLNHSNSEW